MLLGHTIRAFVLMVFLISCNSNEGPRENGTLSKKASHTDSVTAAYAHGKALFQRSCNTCHIAPESHETDNYFFENIFERLPQPSDDYFTRYIKDSKKVKLAGDQHAGDIDKLYGSTYEHRFNDSFSTKEISELILYIKIAGKRSY